MSFFVGSGGQRPPSPSGDSNAQGGKAALPPRFLPAAKMLVRRICAAPPCGAPAVACCPFWVPAARGRLHPPVIQMLGASEFRHLRAKCRRYAAVALRNAPAGAVRQDFCLRQKCLYGAHAPPRSAGPQPVPATFLSEQGTTGNLAAAMVMRFFFAPQQFLSFLLPQKTTKICDIRSLQRIKNHTQLQTKLQMKSASISGGGFLSFRSLHLDAAVGASRRPEGGFSSLSTLHSSLFSHSVKLSPGRRTLASYPSARQAAAKAAGSWAMAGKVS